MEDGDPTTVAEIFADYKGRRRGFLRAFSKDVEMLYSSCDPELPNLRLYAYPNGLWEVIPPAPGRYMPILPEPVLGINFSRDGMRRNDWLVFVATHSDCWLLALVSFFSAPLNRYQRYHLISMINDLPTLSEQVIAARFQ